MRFVIEWTIFTQHPNGIVAEVRCKAASCRADPLIASGSVADVLEKVAVHVRRHTSDFSLAESWLRGERVGARVVR